MYRKIFCSLALSTVLLFFTASAWCRGVESVRYRSSIQGVMDFFSQRGFEFNEQWRQFKHSRKTLDEIKQEILNICLQTAEAVQPVCKMTMWDYLISFFGPSQVVNMTPLNSPLHSEDLIFFGRTWERCLEWSYPKKAEITSFFLALGLALGSLLDEIQDCDNFQKPELIVNNLQLGQCFLYDLSFVGSGSFFDEGEYSKWMLAARAKQAIAVKEMKTGYQKVLYDEQTKSVNFVDISFDECDGFLEEYGAPPVSLITFCWDLFAECFCPIW